MFSRYLNFCCNCRSRRKNGWIRKIRLILKFRTSQSGYKTIAIYILPNISRNKDNHTIKFGQFVDYNKRNIFKNNMQKKYILKIRIYVCMYNICIYMFFKNYAENEASGLVPDLFSFFMVKASGLQLSFNIS